jgi:hypothetical protein
LIDKLAKQADDEGLDEDALMGELDEMDEEGLEAAKIYIKQLKDLVEDSKKKALKEKQANNIEKAKSHLADMKRYQAQLEEQYQIYPKLREDPNLPA